MIPNWEDALISKADTSDPTPIYTQLKREQREQQLARLGFVAVKEEDS